MQLVGRPKLARPLPKALPRTSVEVLLDTVARDLDSKHQTDWAERDLALVLTAVLAGLRADELRQANVGDIRTTDDGAAVIHVKGKGGRTTAPLPSTTPRCFRYENRCCHWFSTQVRQRPCGATTPGDSAWPSASPSSTRTTTNTTRFGGRNRARCSATCRRQSETATTPSPQDAGTRPRQRRQTAVHPSRGESPCPSGRRRHPTRCGTLRPTTDSKTDKLSALVSERPT
jgi:hypothetical protein